MPSIPGISTSSSATSGPELGHGRQHLEARARPPRPPRGRARGRAGPTARRAPGPGRRPAAAGSGRRSSDGHPQHVPAGRLDPGRDRAAHGRGPLAQADQPAAVRAARAAPADALARCRRRRPRRHPGPAAPCSGVAPLCRITLVTPSRTVHANSSRRCEGTSSVELGSSASISAAANAVRARASSPGRVSSR